MQGCFLSRIRPIAWTLFLHSHLFVNSVSFMRSIQLCLSQSVICSTTKEELSITHTPIAFPPRLTTGSLFCVVVSHPSNPTKSRDTFLFFPFDDRFSSLCRIMSELILEIIKSKKVPSTSTSSSTSISTFPLHSPLRTTI